VFFFELKNKGKKMSSRLLGEGDVIRMISLKVPNQPNPRDCVTIASNGDVIACSRPTDVRSRVFTVHVVGDNVFRFENAQFGILSKNFLSHLQNQL
jgi:hypothetical protein